MKRIIQSLRADDDFLIAAHVNPDGDALGSALALSMGLEATGKKTTVYSKDGVPDYCRFLPGHERFIESLDDADTQGMTLILIDCNTPSRAGLEGRSFRRCLVIDHHETESDFGDIQWVDHESPAVGLMVFTLLRELGVALTAEIATNIYAAMAVDTGTFRFSNTTPETFRAAAELMEAGASPSAVADGLYQTWTKNRFALLCMTLGGIEVTDSVGIATITGEMFHNTGTTPADTENFVNYPLLISDVRVSALFRQMDGNSWKISLRSKGELNVARVAVRFEGGGHKNAAGCRIEGDFESARQVLLDAIRSTIL